MRGGNKNPPEAVLGGEASEGWDEAGALPSRLERYAAATGRAREIIAYLGALEHDLAAQSLSERLKGCGDWLEFHHYWTAGKVRLHRAPFCKKHLVCPLCAIRRGARLLERYLAAYDQLRQENPELVGYHVVWTVKNGHDLGRRLDHLQGSLSYMHARRLMKRARSPLRQLAAAVWSFEVTKGETGWHPHAHCVYLAPGRFDVDQLRQEWKSITGDSHVFRIDAFRNPEEPLRAFLEVFKYALKFSDLDLVDLWDAYPILRGRRLVGSLGAFRGIEVPDSLTDGTLDELPFVELFFRYRHRIGYEFAPRESKARAA